MKFKVEVELEDLFEDNYDEGVEVLSLEKIVIESIVSRVSNSVNKNIETIVEAKMQEFITENMSRIINNKIEAILDDYMSKPVSISNGYGQTNYSSLYKFIETKFSELSGSRLDGSCKVNDPLHTKLKNEIEHQVKSAINKTEALITKEATSLVKEEIKTNSTLNSLSKLLEEKGKNK